MSELVEKVEDAIDYQIQNHGYGPHVARAAISAVAEWLSAAIHPEENAYHVREELLKQLEQPK